MAVKSEAEKLGIRYADISLGQMKSLISCCSRYFFETARYARKP